MGHKFTNQWSVAHLDHIALPCGGRLGFQNVMLSESQTSHFLRDSVTRMDLDLTLAAVSCSAEHLELQLNPWKDRAFVRKLMCSTGFSGPEVGSTRSCHVPTDGSGLRVQPSLTTLSQTTITSSRILFATPVRMLGRATFCPPFFSRPLSAHRQH